MDRQTPVFIPRPQTEERAGYPAALEPAGALDGGADGEHWIRAVVDIAPRGLAPGGVVLFEGPEGRRVRE